ncbi:MAG TPA: iron dependent repressor, metal binding and dimerization domain protein [Vicinamibacterales bacterium]|mgnify:FL=1|nr:DtxR family transcriptional regulator [Acidobacteriota bacterium]HOC17031.1 iron dependent repressor, metal binding and dimerization domain protein [Vicinamibacterales bacterium]
MSPLPDPAAALAIFGSLVLLAAILFWPERGIVPRLRRLVELSERVRLEDAVKHLFNSAAAGRTASVDSLAGAVGVSRDRTVEVARELTRLGLARLEGEVIALTEAGRAHALRVIRTHRIWERYLADRTGVGAAEWHALADRLEHKASADEVDRLAASMGDPVYDPHGDPIPTASGVLPPARGLPLSAVAAGASARVVHIEDEPGQVYRSLRAAGVNVGCLVRLDRVDPAGLHLLADGRPVVIDSLAALNLVVELVEEDDTEEGLERLDAIRPGEEAIVVRLGAQIHGAQRRRLLDLGIVPGTVVRAELSSLSGDPVAYRIRGAVIALRRAQADDIVVRRRPRKEAA